MKCPGQDSQYWKPGAIFEAKCPECGSQVEFFKDDTTRKCPQCGHRFVNPELDFGCAAYCKFAEQCIGNLPPELIARKQDLLKDRVAIEVKRYFGRDFTRIGHTMRAARYAEEIGKAENGDLAVILTAAYLHDIGIPEAEKKHGEAGAGLHEEGGAAVARELLEKLGAHEALIEEVCDIVIRHHRPRAREPINFRSVFDGDLIARLEDRQKRGTGEPLSHEEIMESGFLTGTGPRVARRVLGVPEPQGLD
ncbi:MAG: HD domain-containing protein [Thermodesulfobacteriota bacterium]